jgi:hypothetical protein
MEFAGNVAFITGGAASAVPTRSGSRGAAKVVLRSVPDRKVYPDKVTR